MKMRTETKETITAELLPLLDCIFSNDTKIPQIIKNISFQYRNEIKDEYVLCLDDPTIKPISTFMHIQLDKPLKSVKAITAVNRQKVERFSDKIQFVTSVLIHDSERVLFLSNIAANSVYQKGTLSYVQGHVEYPVNLSLTLDKVFKMNMEKELNEELGIINYDGDIKFNPTENPFSPSFIYIDTPPSTNKHCCVLYEMKVDDVTKYYCKEPLKNSIVILPADQIHTHFNNLCPWVLQSLQHSDFIRNTYVNYLNDHF